MPQTSSSSQAAITRSALNAAADCDILGNHAAINRCAIATQEIGSAQLAFNSAEDLRWTFAIDLTDDRHAGPDAKSRPDFLVAVMRP